MDNRKDNRIFRKLVYLFNFYGMNIMCWILGNGLGDKEKQNIIFGLRFYSMVILWIYQQKIMCLVEGVVMEMMGFR